MAEIDPGTTRPARMPSVVKALLLTIFVSAMLFSSWTLLKPLLSASLQGYVKDGIKLSVSNFQIEIVMAGLTGLLTTLFLQGRRGSRKTKASQLKMTPMTFASGEPIHQL